ncbi:MAG: DUF1684 domain-containing protein [Solirubrobacteraceae bacterium]
MTVAATSAGELELAGWRRRVAELYAAVRQAPTPQDGHALWRDGRDRLFQEHPNSPLAADDPLRGGLPYAPDDPQLRWELAVQPAEADRRVSIKAAPGETTRLRRVGDLTLPAPIDQTVAVWWLEQYRGGLFVPIRDHTAGTTSYGGGRYLIDTAKGADLGGRDGHLTIDLNCLYHPSCRYDPQWQCPLAPADNVIAATIDVGEQL